jgi:hypothetical protein
MKRPFAVWTDFRLPVAAIRAAAQLETPRGLRHCTGADIRTIGGIGLVYADGHCGPHSDWPSINLMWVCRNDTSSWVAAQGVSNSGTSPRGPSSFWTSTTLTNSGNDGG